MLGLCVYIYSIIYIYVRPIYVDPCGISISTDHVVHHYHCMRKMWFLRQCRECDLCRKNDTCATLFTHGCSLTGDTSCCSQCWCFLRFWINILGFIFGLVWIPFRLSLYYLTWLKTLPGEGKNQRWSDKCHILYNTCCNFFGCTAGTHEVLSGWQLCEED